MRIKAFQNLLKLSLVSSSFKKINFFLNIAIFLSIFAITTSIISIYFETKITKLEDKIAEHSMTSDLLSLSSQSLPGRINIIESVIDEIKLKEDWIDFIYYSKIGQIFTDRHRFYLPAIRLSGYIENGFSAVETFEELINVSDNDLLLDNIDLKPILALDRKVQNNKKKYFESKNKIKKQHEEEGEYQGGVKIIAGTEFYDVYEAYLIDFKIFTEDQIKFYIAMLDWTRQVHNNLEDKKIILAKEISKNSNISRDFILAAFLLQLFIFAIVQAMEILSTRREINEKK